MTVNSESAPAWRRLAPALALYFGAHVVIRVVVSDALELDEAEQVLWTQALSLGYGAQPPLYTWLQWMVFQATGVSVFGLALLKNTLLASIYAFGYLAARRLMAGPWAGAAAAAMLLLPPLGWEAQRDLTHSVLCTSAAAATLWLVLELIERPRRAAYAGLAVALAAGLLSKYSFALYAAALAGALALSPDTRPLLRRRGMLAAVAVAALLVAPHAGWAVAHAGEISAATLAKTQGGKAGVAWSAATALQGATSLVRAVLGLAAPLGLAVALLWLRRNAPSERAVARNGVAAAWLIRYLLVLGVALLGLALTGAISSFKSRWLLPMLFLLPLAFVAAVPRFGNAPRRRALWRLLAAVALLVLALIALRPALLAQRLRPDELNLPATALVMALREDGWTRGMVRAADAPLAAALRLHGAASHAASHPGPLAGPAQGPTLWIASGQADPARWEAWRGATAAPCGPLRTLSLPYRHARQDAAPMHWTYCIESPG